MTDPYYSDERVTLWHGDCLDVLATLPDASVDSVVTDPPYGLEFMGKEWDAPWKASGVGRGVRVATERADEMTPTGGGHTTSAGPYLAARVDSVRVAGLPFQQWCELWARECLRVLKPGGHLLAFGGTRTWHRLAVAIEDAGFELRDSIAWIYGSGFPKSLDVSKAIDKAAGAEREVVGINPRAAQQTAKFDATSYGAFAGTSSDLTAPATPDAERWQGWGTALKPAFEPVVVARKPLEGTVASNVLAHGTGALNVDGCRVGAGLFVPGGGSNLPSGGIMGRKNSGKPSTAGHTSGRWPANVVLGHTPDCDVIYEGRGEIRLEGPCAPGCPVAELDRQSGESSSRVGKPRGAAHGEGWGMTATGAEYADTGGASRFFYVAKAPTSERPRYNKSVLRLRAGLTPEQVGHVRARLAEAGVRVD